MVDITPSEIDAAGRVAEGIGEEIAKLASLIHGDCAAAASQAGLATSAALRSIVPLWEDHLRNVGANVHDCGSGLRISAGSYVTTAKVEAAGAHRLGGLL